MPTSALDYEMATSSFATPRQKLSYARRRAMEDYSNAALLQTAPPTARAASTYSPVDYSQPPPSVGVAETGRTLAELLAGGPPPMRTGPSSGGLITRGDEVLYVPAGTGYRAAVKAPAIGTSLSAEQNARQQLEASRAAVGLPAGGVDYSQPPPVPPVDPLRRAAARSVADYSRMPGATVQGIADRFSLLDKAGNILNPPARPGQTMDVGGVPFYFQNPNQIAQVPAAKSPVDYSQPPEVGEVGGVKFFRPAPGAEPQLLPAPRPESFEQTVVRALLAGALPPGSPANATPGTGPAPENAVDMFNALRNQPPAGGAASARPAVAPAENKPAASTKIPPREAIAYLVANPGAAAMFDAKYGAGSAARILNR